MNGVEAALRRADADLRESGVGWALVGGFAGSARAEPRFTRDVDVAVAGVDQTRPLRPLLHPGGPRPPTDDGVPVAT